MPSDPAVNKLAIRNAIRRYGSNKASGRAQAQATPMTVSASQPLPSVRSKKAR